MASRADRIRHRAMNDLYWFADNLVLWDRDPAKPEYNLVPYPDGPHRLITEFIMDTA